MKKIMLQQWKNSHIHIAKRLQLRDNFSKKHSIFSKVFLLIALSNKYNHDQNNWEMSF